MSATWPPLCYAANRMMFDARDDLDAYRKRIGMDGYSSGKVWTCEFCGKLHYEGNAPDPAGGSSGTSRKQKHQP